MAIQLRLSRPNELRQARDFAELWSRLTNDEVFCLQGYYQAATGSEITIMSERSGEAWARLREVIDALHLALSRVNKELSALGRETLEADDSDADYAKWMLDLPARLAAADELRGRDYARAIAVDLAGDIQGHALGISRHLNEGKLNDLILFAGSAG